MGVRWLRASRAHWERRHLGGLPMACHTTQGPENGPPKYSPRDAGPPGPPFWGALVVLAMELPDRMRVVWQGWPGKTQKTGNANMVLALPDHSKFVTTQPRLTVPKSVIQVEGDGPHPRPLSHKERGA